MRGIEGSENREGRRPVWWRLLCGALLIYGGLCLLIFLLQGRLLYYPTRILEVTPRALGLAFQDVELETEDGVKLGAWWVPAESARGAVVFCHGNAGNISDRLEALQAFHALRFQVLLFDFRGYGSSEGKPSEEGTYRDAVAAYDYVVSKRGVSAERILIYGESLGGAIGVELAVRRQAAALITEATFASLPDMAAALYPWLPARWLTRFSYDSAAKAPKLTLPWLQLHSPTDELVPFSQAQKLHAASGPNATFQETSGGHNDGGFRVDREARRALEDFVEKYYPID